MSQRTRAICLWVTVSLSAAVSAARGAGEAVAYASHDGFRVRALLYRPGEGASRAVFILPDGDEGKEDWIPLADTLRLRGFFVLVPDLRGTGESLMHRGIRRERAAFTARERSVSIDAAAAVEFLRSEMGGALDGLAVVAGGAGALDLRSYLARYARPACAVWVSPRVSSDVRNGRYPARPEGFDAPVLLLSGGDDLLGIEVAAHAYRDPSPRSFWIVQSRARGAELFQDRPDLIGRCADWIDETIP